jgi:dipeptidyl aminopeptidase/acylaminoacyl peptidase
MSEKQLDSIFLTKTITITMKKILTVFSFAAISLATMFMTPVAQSQDKALETQAFSHTDIVEMPVVSPDGKTIAAVYNSSGDSQQVVVSPFGKVELTTILKLKNTTERIVKLRWVNPDRILVSADYPEHLGGSSRRVGQLYAVNKDGSELQEIKLRKLSSGRDWSWLFSGDQIVSMLPKDANHILLQQFSERDNYFPSVYKINVYSGQSEKYAPSLKKPSYFIGDSTGQSLVGVTVDGLTRSFFLWQEKAENWKPIGSYKMLNEDSFTPVLYEPQKNTLIVKTYQQGDTEQVWRLSLDTQEWVEPLFVNDKYDVSRVLENNGEVIGFSYIADLPQVEYIAPAYQQRQQLVEQTFKGLNPMLVSFDAGMNRMLIKTFSASAPSRLYFVDLTNKSGGLWMALQPALENQSFPAKEPIEFEAQDGFKVNGYLINGGDAERPLVVMPHGGPTSRDTQVFSPLEHMFVNAGYAVLQVNFRGSSGFGANYEAQGYGQWGQLMQQDVLDGVNWAQEQGLASTDDSCVVGWSYGGYVSLYAATKTPNKFNCYVSVAGVSDINTILNDTRASETAEMVDNIMVGDRDSEAGKKQLASLSPINHIGTLKQPTLLVHGTGDVVVPDDQSQAFYDAAAQYNLPVELLLLEDGTHSLDSNPNRTQAFERIVGFVRDNIGG